MQDFFWTCTSLSYAYDLEIRYHDTLSRFLELVFRGRDHLVEKE